MRFEGTITSWNDERGFGFIAPTRGDREVFVHIRAFGPRAGRPKIGQRVVFEVELAPDGRKRAKNVEPVRLVTSARPYRNENPARWGTASLFALPAFFSAYTIAAAVWRVPGWVGGLYLGASIVTFALYWTDKSAANAGTWRISEAALLSAGLIGGWPGAIVAQQSLRHKSNKASFRAAFWITVLVNVVAFLALTSPLRLRLFRA